LPGGTLIVRQISSDVHLEDVRFSGCDAPSGAEQEKPKASTPGSWPAPLAVAAGPPDARASDPLPVFRQRSGDASEEPELEKPSGFDYQP